MKILLLLLLSCPMMAQMGMVHASVAAHLVGTTLDAASSWNQPEMNPWLRSQDGRFGWQGVQRKAIVSAVIVGATYLIAWKVPKARRAMAYINLGYGATMTGVAARNWSAR